jgi:hypothetical protein
MTRDCPAATSVKSSSHSTCPSGCNGGRMSGCVNCRVARGRLSSQGFVEIIFQIQEFVQSILRIRQRAHGCTRVTVLLHTT